MINKRLIKFSYFLVDEFLKSFFGLNTTKLKPKQTLILLEPFVAAADISCSVIQYCLVDQILLDFLLKIQGKFFGENHLMLLIMKTRESIGKKALNANRRTAFAVRTEDQPVTLAQDNFIA